MKLPQWLREPLIQQRSNILHVILASSFINIFALASPLYIMNVYDRVIANQTYETLWFLTLGIAIVLLFDFLLKQVRTLLVDTSAQKADLELSQTVYQKVFSLSLYEKPRNSSDLINRLESYKGLRNFFNSSTITAISDIPFIFIFILVLFWIAPSIAIIPIVFLPIMILTNYLLERPIKGLMQQRFYYESKNQSLSTESLVGFESIKSLQLHTLITSKLFETTTHQLEINKKINYKASTILSINSLFQQLASILVICVGVYLIGSRSLTMGGLIASVAITSRIITPFIKIASLNHRYQMALISLDALDKIFKYGGDSPDQPLILDKLQGNIEIENVEFHFPQEKRSVLNQLNLKISPGEKIALLGKNGAGKTTLIRIISGLYPASHGIVRLDGLDASQLSAQQLRSKMSYLGASESLFSGSLRYNLTIGKSKKALENLNDVIKLCGVDKIIEESDQGLDRIIGEGGTGLSNGQKQSVLLARALLNNASVILLDEPTNDMDSVTENDLIHKLKPYFKDKTLIIVTNKISMLNLVDRILVLEQGMLIADDPKEIFIKKLNKATKNENK
jgi:ATP-binding cassette subfamily C protein LapB